jgi:hypothetical protein
MSLMWYQLVPKCSDTPGHSVLAALSQSGVPGVPAAFQDASDSGHVREGMQVGTCPVGPTIAPPPFVQAHPPAGLACQSLSGCPSDRLLPSDL